MNDTQAVLTSPEASGRLTMAFADDPMEPKPLTDADRKHDAEVTVYEALHGEVYVFRGKRRHAVPLPCWWK